MFLSNFPRSSTEVSVALESGNKSINGIIGGFNVEFGSKEELANLQCYLLVVSIIRMTCTPRVLLTTPIKQCLP